MPRLSRTRVQSLPFRMLSNIVTRSILLLAGASYMAAAFTTFMAFASVAWACEHFGQRQRSR